MANLIDGLVKGLSGFLPQDDPDVKILNAQADLRTFPDKEKEIYARLGRAVYEADGAESHPEIKAQLEALLQSRKEVEERLQAAKLEKEARDKAAAEEKARREAEEQARSCPNCGSYNPEGTNFCQECGTRLAQPVQQEVANKFCPNCGAAIAPGHRFCSGCGTKVE